MKKTRKKQKTPTFRYFRCEGAAFELLKAYRDELELLMQNRVKLNKEFQERSDVMYKHHQSNLQAMWARLSAMVGLDPAKTWGNPEYQIEARYIAEGFGAILYTPQPRGDALHELLGGISGQPVNEDDPFGEAVPDKSKLN